MAVPKGLKGRGRRLWESVVEAHELDGAQEVMLEEACRLAVRLDELDRRVAEEGADSSAARHARDSAQAMARLIAALRLPDESGKRPQRRQMRGVQGPSKFGSAKDRLKVV